ncbi:MAG: hypothetical protein SCALA702_01950 [Melioribacteraceae bacterium]|nr:MAG: hypothetical protein SCALA702_01950 [Melioribacteraceae bacterium]
MGASYQHLQKSDPQFNNEFIELLSNAGNITTASTRIKPVGCAKVINILGFDVDNFYSIVIWV